MTTHPSSYDFRDWLEWNAFWKWWGGKSFPFELEDLTEEEKEDRPSTARMIRIFHKFREVFRNDRVPLVLEVPSGSLYLSFFEEFKVAEEKKAAYNKMIGKS